MDDSFILLSDDELEQKIKELDNRISIHAKNHLYRQCLTAYVTASSKMLDSWSESDKKVKQKLWQTLHACERRARLLLESD